ncbi:hypothetical protein L1049_000348 [Liquidambar formosana]|uniref:Uncharacterized protein n=1 Tax=Liquidambar formosana TaxID=63359 RepID=A0AAP0N8M6_LIQFO
MKIPPSSVSVSSQTNFETSHTKMQGTSQKPIRERLLLPARPSAAGDRWGSFRVRHDNGMASSPRPRGFVRTSSSSNHLGSIQRSRHRYGVPSEKSRRNADKEILKRALSPPTRRSRQRCWNFRPTPSRLCKMSMA